MCTCANAWWACCCCYSNLVYHRSFDAPRIFRVKPIWFLAKKKRKQNWQREGRGTTRIKQKAADPKTTVPSPKRRRKDRKRLYKCCSSFSALGGINNLKKDRKVDRRKRKQRKKKTKHIFKLIYYGLHSHERALSCSNGKPGA